MTEKEEEFLREQLRYFISDNISLYTKAFDKEELTVTEFAFENERITKNFLNNINWIMDNN